MKIIDKTPLVDAKGNLTLVNRVQGMLQYGFNWPRELEAQSAIIQFFDRQLEKGYTLIRNLPLGQSGIIIPMILLGPTGIYVIEVSHLRGRYEARGDAWNVEAGSGYKPAPVNLIQRTQRMARALTAFIERQGVRIPVTIDPILIAGDPGLHIESVRPAIKVMMIDGIKAFVNSLATGSPVLSGMQVNDFVDRIENPRPRVDMSAPAPMPVPEPEPATETWDAEPGGAWGNVYGWQEPPTGPSQPEPSRARAIFNAADQAQSFDPNSFDFAMAEEEAHAEDIPPVSRAVESGSEPAAQPPRSRSQLIMGMTTMQIAILAGLALALVCILAVFAYMVLTS